MCFIIAIVGLVMAFNFFMAQKIILAIGALSISVFFIYLMIKNIREVQRLKGSKK
jgi:uncharacterized protein (DUF983 family)